MEETLGIIAIFIISIGFFYFMFRDVKTTHERMKKLEEESKEINRYLDSVYNRINTASSYQALLLLRTEMYHHSNEHNYNNTDYCRFKCLCSYLMGRAQTLKSPEFILEDYMI